jgi:hypothetical protein
MGMSAVSSTDIPCYVLVLRSGFSARHRHPVAKELLESAGADPSGRAPI